MPSNNHTLKSSIELHGGEHIDHDSRGNTLERCYALLLDRADAAVTRLHCPNGSSAAFGKGVGQVSLALDLLRPRHGGVI